MFLTGKDGINGPDIDQLRKVTTANVNGAGDSHFKDTAFVKAAKDMSGRPDTLFSGKGSASRIDRSSRRGHDNVLHGSGL